MHMPDRLQHRFARSIAGLLLAVATAAAGTSAYANPDAYKAAIDHKARDQDRKNDARLKPAEFLAFAGVKPGMKALDVASGGGATAELLALAVGPTGEVWAQTVRESPKLKERLTANPQPNLHPVVAPFDKPVPAGAPALDLITINMSYHDIANTPTDRAAMNKALYDALKPGGKLVIVDNAAKDGSGLAATKELHRIDQKAVVAEVTKAGFAVDGTSDYLHVAADPRDQAFFNMKGQPDDKFAVRFIKK
ncbi:methyltransferase domain-containing protein [Massilia arenosa]|uniref:Methyltransferase domain-containing protein n=1 Tax=Zemynaea arenosa TaxID=2561931 RepID=A0A4Y9SGM5_9BURK|nr:class I SAM-dependent methyltransferase [Massilia arenosa]TFW23279.1 methyltransferase domain-containing protein [Massilia arenosa]